MYEVASLHRFQQIPKRCGDHITRRIFTAPQRRKVRLATFDLRVFFAAQVVCEQAALGFHDEVQPLRAVLVKQDALLLEC